MRREKVIDADFELVSGPFREGDEHPDKPGWYWTGRKNAQGEWLWYKPPHPAWRWLLYAIFPGLPILGLLIVLVVGA
jgi:hypothetical protein